MCFKYYETTATLYQHNPQAQLVTNTSLYFAIAWYKNVVKYMKPQIVDSILVYSSILMCNSEQNIQSEG